MRLTEVAKRLFVHKSAVIRWMKKGLIQATLSSPPKGVGGHDYWDISEEELERYLKECNREGE